MTNLIFDLNNLCFRSLYTISAYGSKQYSFDSQAEIDQLMRKISTDVAYIIRLINPSRVIFTLDDKSWRRDIKIDENEGYKANRIKSTFINWNNIYSALNEFSDIMQENGMIVTKIENSEADDIVALWSNELQINQQQHVIIVSGDEDLRQLVNYHPYDTKFAFITVFNPFMQGKNASRKLYVPKFFETWINETELVDIFNLKTSINVDKEDFRKIINSEKTKLEVINGRMIGLRKLFCGDDGDNVPAIYTWITKTKSGEDEVKRITNSKFEKIYESLLTSPNELINHNDLLKRHIKVKDELEKVTKQEISFDVKKRLERQIKLTILDKQFFPEDIVNKFEELKEKELSKPRINYANINMYNLLEGTRYVKERKIKNEASIFNEIDKVRKTSLF